MTARENFNRLYADVSENISSAMKDISSINVDHKDGEREIRNITNKLTEIQARFNDELRQLRDHAEWEKFTLAFFGETNAGKSTIIESLRILFKEESRQALLAQHGDDLETLSQELQKHLEYVREGLHALCVEYTNELISIKQGTNKLVRIVHQEALERNEIAKSEAGTRALLAEQEIQARLEILQQESSDRLSAERQEASRRLEIEREFAVSRFRGRVVLIGIGGALTGAMLTFALLKFSGA